VGRRLGVVRGKEKILVKVGYSEREKERIKENIQLIVEESKFRFNNQKEAWNDLDKKVFYLLSFISLFVGFIIVNNLFNIFSEQTPIIFKLSILLGLAFLFSAGFSLVKIILPTEFKTSASSKDLRELINNNKLHNLKFELIGIYEKMNDDNEKHMNERAKIYYKKVRLTIIGLLLIFISKSLPFLVFIGGK
jgi:hypothetical protein